MRRFNEVNRKNNPNATAPPHSPLERECTTSSAQAKTHVGNVVGTGYSNNCSENRGRNERMNIVLSGDDITMERFDREPSSTDRLQREDERETAVESGNKRANSSNNNRRLNRTAPKPNIRVFSIEDVNQEGKPQQDDSGFCENTTALIPSKRMMAVPAKHSKEKEPSRRKHAEKKKIKTEEMKLELRNETMSSGSQCGESSKYSVGTKKKHPTPGNSRKAEELGSKASSKKSRSESDDVTAELLPQTISPCIDNEGSSSNSENSSVQVPLTVFPQYWSRREKMRNAPCLAQDFWSGNYDVASSTL